MAQFFARNTQPAHMATKTATDLGSPAPCDRHPDAGSPGTGHGAAAYGATATATHTHAETDAAPDTEGTAPEKVPPAEPPPAGAEQAPAPHTRRELALVFSGLIMAVLISALDQTIVSTALPTIVGDLRGLDHLSWVITAYLLTSTIGLPIYGKLGDLLGRKNIFIFAIVVFLLGSALSGQAHSMAELISYRALQGVGGGGLIIGAQAIIGDIVSARDRGKYMGLIGAAFGLASVSGPLMGGYLTEYWSWRWVFYINLPLGAIALALIITSLHLPRRSAAGIWLDYPGAILLAVASAALMGITSWGGTTYAWTSPTILGLGAAALVAIAVFIPVELRAPEPILPLRLFRIRNFGCAPWWGSPSGWRCSAAFPTCRPSCRWSTVPAPPTRG